jgi:glycosyltransferase involved in cell wall biosynthesis
MDKISKPKFFFVTTIPLSLWFYEGQISYFKRRFNIELVATAGENLDKIAKQENVKTHPISIKREISIIHDIVSLYRLTILFVTEKPNIVHAGTPKAGFLSMIAAWFVRVPVRIYYLHGLRYEGTVGFKRKLLIKMEQLACYLSTNIFVASKGVKKTVLKDKLTARTVNIIGKGSVNGIRTSFYNPELFNPKELKSELDIPNNTFIFGFVGRLVKDKGVNELVAAFIRLQQEYASIALLIVGGYENLSNPVNNNTKNEIKLNKHIISVGFQKDVRPYMAMMNVFLLPSYREGFGISLAEAQSMNIPAIASNISGCNEIIVHNQTGLLIEPKSVEKIYSAMKKLMVDKELYRECKLNSRENIKNKFEQQLVWKLSLEAYDQLKVS